ncbi:MAG TPA: c-type cytochrome [Candidatus Angelobacter sp.]|nr:c-type cytochrome [Candidatus Angelobacter sp.]
MNIETTPQRPTRRNAVRALARCLSMAFVLYVLAVLIYLPHASSAAVVAAAPDGDATRGSEIFNKRCTGCHSLDGEKEGPRLRGVFGRKSATVPTFKYSDALKKANITWDAGSLNKWLTGPDKFVPDNDMDFRLVKDDERADVIAYLKQLSGK